MFKNVDPAAGAMSVRIASGAKDRITFGDCEKCRKYAILDLAQWGHMLSPLFVCPTCIAEAIKTYGEWEA